jgi:serine kinase of HPr protein (carbohydrate metabolism regulator)
MKIDSGLEELATKVFFESEEERKLFSSKIFKNRLCFKESSDVLGQLSIKNGDYYNYSSKSQIIIFPWDGLNLKKDSYYFRFAFDMNSIKNGNLPLHCGAINCNKKGIFIFGESKSGKSLIINSLDFMNLGEIVGDDHIIIRDSSMAGNQLIGFRKKGSEIKSYRSLKKDSHSFEDYIITIVDVRKDRKINFGRSNIREELITNDATKYFLNKPMQPEFANIIGIKEIKSLQQRYSKKFNEFVNKARGVYQIYGGPDYIKDKLLEISKK